MDRFEKFKKGDCLMEMTCTIIGGIILYLLVGMIFCGIEERWHSFNRFYGFVGGEKWTETSTMDDKMAFVYGWIAIIFAIFLLSVKKILLLLIRKSIKPAVFFFINGFRRNNEEGKHGQDKF